MSPEAYPKTAAQKTLVVLLQLPGIVKRCKEVHESFTDATVPGGKKGHPKTQIQCCSGLD